MNYHNLLHKTKKKKTFKLSFLTAFGTNTKGYWGVNKSPGRR